MFVQIIAISVYCYLIKYKAKQKDLLSIYVTSNKLNKFCINNILIKMESKNELKEIDIKIRTCYCFDDIIKDRDHCSVNILLDENSYEIYEFNL